MPRAAIPQLPAGTCPTSRLQDPLHLYLLCPKLSPQPAPPGWLPAPTPHPRSALNPQPLDRPPLHHSHPTQLHLTGFCLGRLPRLRLSPRLSCPALPGTSQLQRPRHWPGWKLPQFLFSNSTLCLLETPAPSLIFSTDSFSSPSDLCMFIHSFLQC